jgi:uncharacterized membrane protein
MNKWIADIFGNFLTVLHVVVVVGLLVFFAITLEKTQNIYLAAGLPLVIFIGYIFVVGTMVTIISMRQTLERIENLLKSGEGGISS